MEHVLNSTLARWSELGAIEFFSCLVLAIAGVWMLIHFACKALFLLPTAPTSIMDSICMCSGSGMFLAITAISGQADNLLIPTSIALVCVLIFDGWLWLYRFRVCDFSKVQK
jgi:hypothetical protein